LRSGRTISVGPFRGLSTRVCMVGWETLLYAGWKSQLSLAQCAHA
jgi:hypothetical protein